MCNLIYKFAAGAVTGATGQTAIDVSARPLQRGQIMQRDAQVVVDRQVASGAFQSTRTWFTRTREQPE